MTARNLLVCLLLACPFATADRAQAQDLPILVIPGEGTRPLEGDVDHVVQVHWEFTSPLASEARFKVATDESTAPSATVGEDYLAIPPMQIVVPAGQQRGSVALTIKGDTIVEANEMMFIRFYDFQGGGGPLDTSFGETVAGILIMNDDQPPSPPLIANDDHVRFVINEGAMVFPGENDVHDPWNVLRDTVLTVIEPPRHGTLVQNDFGSGIDYFGYTPETDFAGLDSFRYRLCKADGGQCIEATVHLRGELRSGSLLAGSGRTAGLQVEFSNLPALTNARFLPSSLSHMQRLDLWVGVDATPDLAWDSRDGTAWTTGVLPASPPGETIERRVLARTVTHHGDMVDLRIGLDRDGDGQPSQAEEACIAVRTVNEAPDCLLVVEVGDQPVSYWISVHSREDAARTASVERFEIRMEDPGTVLRTTSALKVDRHGLVNVTTSWTDPMASGPLAAFVTLRDGERWVGEYRMDLYGSGGGKLLLPVDGSTTSVALPPNSMKWWEDRELFFDVPPGTDALTLTMRGDAPISFAAHWFGYEERHESLVRDSGASEPDASYVQAAAGQARTIRITTPRAGRWYALVRNHADRDTRVEVGVDIEARVNPVRPGSYFNPSQSGHGLFVYPAGSQWAALWYTYNRRAQPVWYYLQAPRPGEDGVWRAPVYMNFWEGTSARKSQVGVMQVTPWDEGRFMMSYLVDGYAGSQLMDPLGGGCPRSGGQDIDISSHWFDPARSGHGYSVQTWASGYQFIAAFTYDSQGFPVFLSAERNDLGDQAADLALEILSGTCPTGCSYREPQRRPAGVLRRILSAGALSEITLDVDYEQSWPYQGRETHTTTDRIQLLGGPGTTQGCAP